MRLKQQFLIQQEVVHKIKCHLRGEGGPKYIIGCGKSGIENKP